MTNYDLSPQVFRSLTPHLIAPILKTLQQQQVYPVDALIKQRYKVLSQTRNYTALLALLDESPNVVPQANKAQIQQDKKAIDAEIEQAKIALGPLGGYLDVVAKMDARGLQNLKRETIVEVVRLEVAHIPALAVYAALNRDAGEYMTAAYAYLVYFLLQENVLAGPNMITKELLWKMTEVGLLCQQHHVAIYELFSKKLREMLDAPALSLTLAQQNAQRSTYIAYALYAFTTNPQSNALLSQRSVWSEMIYSQQVGTAAGSTVASQVASNERFINSLLFETPSLLRYAALCALIAARVPSSPTHPWLLKKTGYLRELIRIVQIQYPNMSAEQQTDPILRFVQQILIDFDIQGAINTLNNDIPELFKQDPFLQLHALQLEFYESAKAILVDTVMKLNTNFTLAGLQAMIKLNITCDGFDNTIVLLSAPKDASAQTTAPTTKDDAAAAAATAIPEIVSVIEDVEDEVVATTNATEGGVVYVSPLLGRADFHNRLMKKAKPQPKFVK